RIIRITSSTRAASRLARSWKTHRPAAASSNRSRRFGWLVGEKSNHAHEQPLRESRDEPLSHQCRRKRLHRKSNERRGLAEQAHRQPVNARAANASRARKPFRPKHHESNRLGFMADRMSCVGLVLRELLA